MLAPRASIVSVFGFPHSQSNWPPQINKAPFAPCRTVPKGFHLALDDITRLMDAGKEKGYLIYNEVNDLIPHDVHSSEDLNDLLTTIGTQGIDVLEGQPRLSSSGLKNKFEEEVEPGEVIGLVPSLGAREKTNDPVRIYLREMGAVPLLARKEEVDIAKRIECGQLRVLKGLPKVVKRKEETVQQRSAPPEPGDSREKIPAEVELFDDCNYFALATSFFFVWRLISWCTCTVPSKDAPSSTAMQGV
jgi:hypothetical protein